MSEAHRTIMDNLDNRVYGVNGICAISGIADTAVGLAALRELVEARRVSVEHTARGPLYRKVHTYAVLQEVK